MTKFTEDEPYFTVLTDPRFCCANLTAATRAEFFASGDTLVEFLWRTIKLRLAPDFAPTAILEYGCGPGRLAIPLARRAARRRGTVTAVDRSPGMLGVARREAEAAGIDAIQFDEPEALFARTSQFDLIVCYLVLQRLPPSEGLELVRRLLGRIVTGGVGVFQFPYRSSARPLVSSTRWLREHVPGVNSLTNVARGRPSSQPFVPTHPYVIEDVLTLFEQAGFPATYVAFDDHADVSSVIVFAERPLDRRRGDGPPSARIDVQELIASTSIEQLNRSAEEYFASLSSWEHHLAKPFSSADEAPWLLTHLAVIMQALRLRPGSTVLEFGAGTGWLSRFLTQLGCKAVLLDVSPTALRIARELYERVPVVGAQPVPEFLLFDGARIELKDASVERIVCFHAFHHVPHPSAVIAEFGRILAPGGLAVFAEPGPTHSLAAQSQFEMRTYGVVENDVDVHDVWRTAQACGFADLKMMVFHGLPFHVSLEGFEDFLRGGASGVEWLTEARMFLRNVRNFVLVKDGVERADSRSSSGLACEIHAQPSEDCVLEGKPIRFTVTLTNTGQAVWLPRSVPYGGVSLGVRVFDELGALLSSEVLSTALTDSDREIAPGEVVNLGISLPARPAGRYIVELDCVSDRVGWFGQLGSRPARAEIESLKSEV
jgi:SAM-dependent methyltransferase